MQRLVGAEGARAIRQVLESSGGLGKGGWAMAVGLVTLFRGRSAPTGDAGDVATVSVPRTASPSGVWPFAQNIDNKTVAGTSPASFRKTTLTTRKADAATNGSNRHGDDPKLFAEKTKNCLTKRCPLFTIRVKQRFDSNFQGQSMKKYCALFCSATVGAFLAFSDQAAAGNLLATDGPSFTPAGAVSNNTAVLQQANSSLVQLFGKVSNQVAANRSVMLALGRTSPLAAVLEDAGQLALRGDQKTGMQEAVTLVPLSLSATSSKASTFGVDSAFPAKDGAAEMAPTPALDVPNLSLDVASTLSLDMSPNLLADVTLLDVSNDSLDFEMTPTAIPEPSTYALVGFGLAALLFVSRRRNSVRA